MFDVHVYVYPRRSLQSLYLLRAYELCFSYNQLQLRCFITYDRDQGGLVFEQEINFKALWNFLSFSSVRWMNAARDEHCDELMTALLKKILRIPIIADQPAQNIT